VTRGTTLVELVIVLAILGLVTGMTGLAIRSLQPDQESATLQAISRARSQALEQGRPVRLVVDTIGVAIPQVLLFLPDGRVLGNRQEGTP
jgi:prepilin-type N-terminal cleavage/methylation domain-containing protein